MVTVLVALSDRRLDMKRLGLLLIMVSMLAMVFGFTPTLSTRLLSIAGLVIGALLSTPRHKKETR